MIKTANLPVLADESATPALQANPFLHVGEDRVYDPLRDRTLQRGEPGYAELRQVLSGALTPGMLAAEDRAQLSAQGWLLAGKAEPARQFRLKYVSLEAHTVCNQACYFCPVSIAPREDYFMPTELYERIVGELACYRDTIETVFMINYNEPTADRRFVDQVRTIKAAGLPPAVLTNGSGLTPDRVDALVAVGGLRFLSINLSTLDRERYRRDRGGDHLELVLRNLDYAKDQPLAEQMDMVVLGTGNDEHRRDFDEISRRFAGSRFEVKYFEVMDRAGYLQIGLKPATRDRRLCGCENVGSRPLQHIHITPRGRCVLCCEDYDEKYVVGDLTRESVHEVLTGPEMARMRRWVYGLEEAPKDFICRGCTFALTRPS
ncbi:MAG TPA: radical SAM/SPASM domain-containing protein [Thermoanaerobaculia bacterium]|jgi:MoaA/NifB/PqqE/SkfB family radical SAM enzyme|nr:radical SAM/SPASM domain-containing protein [Thermoanaerobaculia bacterium]